MQAALEVSEAQHLKGRLEVDNRMLAELPSKHQIIRKTLTSPGSLAEETTILATLPLSILLLPNMHYIMCTKTGSGRPHADNL